MIKQTKLPPNWKTARLGDKDVAFTTSGGTPNRAKPENFGGDILWVKSGELNDRCIYDAEERITKYGLTNSSAKLFPPGTLLVALYGATAGKTAILEVEAATNQAICAIFPKNNSFDSRFLQFELIHFRPKLLNARSGGAQPNISQTVLGSFDVILPPLSEQHAIARVLRAVQETIEARRKELHLERERKATLMKHLFTRGTRGEARKQTGIGEMPESWQVVKLAELCANDSGVIQTGPFGSQLHASDYKESGIPVVNPTHLGFNTIVEDRLPFINKEDADRLSKHYLIEGDILISRRGDFSRYSYVSKRYAGWLCGTGCLLIRLKNNLVDNFFLSVSMGLETVQNYLTQNAVGSIMPNLNTRILGSLPLPIPAIEEQQLIAQALHSCSTKIAAIEKESALLDELFRAMLEKLMTGNLSTLPLIED